MIPQDWSCDDRNNEETKIKHHIRMIVHLFLAALLLVSCSSGDTTMGGGITPRFAYVANNSDNTVSIYTVNAATGQLRHNGYVVAGTNPNAVAVDPFGRFAYVANDGGNVYAYTINASTGTLTGAGSAVPAGMNSNSVSVDPTGHYVFVTNSGSNDVSVFRMNTSTGALTQINCPPSSVIPDPCNNSNYTAGAKPQSVTIDPTGRFAYVANLTSADVSAYLINSSNGTLQPINCYASCSLGGYFPAGNAPRAVTVDPTGKFAYVANSVGGDVTAYTINSASGALSKIDCGGALTVCNGSNFKAGISPQSVSVDPSGMFAYVANGGSNDVTAYSIDAGTGALTFIPCGGSAACNGNYFKAGSSPHSIHVDPSGMYVYVANFGSNDVSVFGISALSGSLTLTDTIRARAGGTSVAVASGLAAVSYTPQYAYVPNTGTGDISAYTISSNGALTRNYCSAVVDCLNGNFTTGSNPNAATSNPTGQFVYVAATSGVYAYKINASDGALNTETGPYTLVTATAPVSIAVESSGKYAYVANHDSSNVTAFAINAATGVLGSGSPFTTGAGSFPTSVITDPTGQFVYVASSGSNDVAAYKITPATGALFQIDASGALGIQNFPAGSNPSSVTVDPSGRFAYVANSGSNDVSAYTINATNGALTAVTGSPFTAGTGPSSITVDQTGKYAYVTNHGTTTISVFAIDAATGALSAAGTGTAGNTPQSVTVDPSGKFAYVTNDPDNTLQGYNLDGTSGALSGIGSAIATGTSPKTIAVTARIE